MSFNIHIPRWFLVVLALLGAFVLGVWSAGAFSSSQPSAVSFGTGFTYQGFLRDSGGNPLTDSCELTFRLYDALDSGNQVGGDDVVSGVAVSDGLFTTVINDSNEFGAAGFNGGGRYLDISVQCSGDASPTSLTPRQPINAVPYARFAERFAGYENLIVVAEQGGDFSSVTEAVNAIGVDTVYPAASSSNRYLIYVAPGIYQDESIQMKEYVDIEGSGRGVTVLTSNGGADGIKPESATLVGASNAELRHVTVENISSAPENWAFAIYTAADTTFSDVTGRASGGSYPRGMVVHDGGAALLKDVALFASGGSVSNTGLDIYLASAVADGLFLNAAGGVDANGIYVNNASSVVKLENVTSFVSGGATQTNGMFITQSEVDLGGYDTTVSSDGTLVSGVFCASANSRLNAHDISVTGSKESVSGSMAGILVENCDLTLRDASAEVSSRGTTYGLYFMSSDTQEVAINQLDIRANSSEGVVYGMNLTGSGDGGATGRMRDITIQASGNLATSNSYGLRQNLQGQFDYQDVAIEITGQARFMYGIQAVQGNPAVQNADIHAYGNAQITVFGIEYTDSVLGGSVENARILAENDGGLDAVGLKANAAQSFSFHNVSTRATAAVGVWGFDFLNGIISATDIDALVEGTADGSIMRGIRCHNGSADIQNARLTVQASGPTITPTLTYGADINNCDLTLSSSEVRARGANGSRYGLYANASSGAPTYFVRDSYLSGETSAIRTLGYTDLSVVNSQLDGGATSTGSPNDKTTCTAVTHGSGTSFSFTAGPVEPCP